MTEPSLHATPDASRRSVRLWSAIAAPAGLAAFVLPHALAPATESAKHYGHPVIPWFAAAFADVHFSYSAGAFFVLGVVLGVAQPHRRLRMTCMAASLPFLLHAVDIVGDWLVDPTDHNLFPFEFAYLAVVCLPVALGVRLGALLARPDGPAAPTA